MSRKGWPGLGSAFTGFLHRHQTNATFPLEMKKHVVVDIEDWKIARKMYAESKATSDNKQSVPLCHVCHEPMDQVWICPDDDCESRIGRR